VKLQVLKILTSMARLVNSISLYAVILIMYLYEKIRAKQLGEKIIIPSALRGFNEWSNS